MRCKKNNGAQSSINCSVEKCCKKGFVYNSESELYLVYDHAKYEDYEFKVILKPLSDLGITPKVEENGRQMPHEIILGRVDRELSMKAYEKLETMEKPGEDGGRIVIYSDASSVAVAYDEEFGNFTKYIALNYFADNLVKPELSLDEGVVYQDSFVIPERLGELDKKYMDLRWNEMAQKLGKDGQEVVDAFKYFYELYDGEKIITWLAGLYDPDICVCKSLHGEKDCKKTNLCGTGGFYYSYSARNNVGFLPDAESCAQALAIIGNCGLSIGLRENCYSAVLPTEIGKKICDFVYNLQDEDGFFYHPQWGKEITLSRRGRDHTWCTNILGTYHVPKKYAQVASATPQVAKEAPKQEFAVAPHLETIDAFKSYLNELDIANKSYPAGNTLSAQSTQIQARGKEYIDVLVDELTRIYNMYGNGTFHHTVDYYAINGVMKLVGQFTGAGLLLPDILKTARACFKAITSEEEPQAIVDIWNPWVAFNRCINNLEKCCPDGKEKALELKAELYRDYAAAIRATKDKLALFQKPDCSFSYFPERSSHTSQGMPVSIPYTNEGDVNSTLMGTTSFTYELFTLVNPLGLGRLPFAQTRERYLFYKMIRNKKPIEKIAK